jgi:putative membrane protein
MVAIRPVTSTGPVEGRVNPDSVHKLTEHTDAESCSRRRLIDNVFVPLVAGAETKIPPSPQDFVIAVAQSDEYEIEAARVAVVQSRDPRIISFAQMMVRDHTRTGEDLRRAVQASHLPAPDRAMSSDQASMLGSLQSVRGADFDKAYARQQVLAHAQAFAVEQSFATAGSDSNLRKAAQAALPTIKEHLKAVQQLSMQIGAS